MQDDTRSGSIVGTRLVLEGLVVVASILVAFALDAWWDRRNEREVERAHLRALHSDFQQNVSRLESLIEREQGIVDASGRLLVAGSTPDANLANDSLFNLLSRLFNSGRFDPVMGAYEAVVGSGGLAQIRNDSLRLALADFASLVQGRYWERFADELYLDFIRSFTGRLGIGDAVIASEFTAVARAGGSPQQNEQLITDPKFREHLALRYLAERDVTGSYRGLLEKARRVRNLTEGALTH